jgi:hypothetical protein
MLPLDWELLDAAEETGTVEKTINVVFGVICWVWAANITGPRLRS